MKKTLLFLSVLLCATPFVWCGFIQSPTTGINATNGNGTSGQVLQTNGDGTQTWVAQTPATPGGAANLGVFQNGISVSSPTSQINFIGPPFSTTLGGSSTATVTMNASSVTLQGNIFNGATQLIQTNGSSLISNSNVDASSITKAGQLIGGSNITLTPSGGQTTIAVSGNLGSSIYPATSTVFFPTGLNVSTITYTGLGATAGALKINSLGVVAASTYSLVGSINFAIDGGGSPIVAGSTRSVVIPYDCSISSWSLVADQSGSIAIDIERSVFASYPPSVSLVGASGNKPSLTSQSFKGATPASWTATYINAGDVLSFVVNSASTVQWVNLVLWVTKI